MLLYFDEESGKSTFNLSCSYLNVLSQQAIECVKISSYKLNESDRCYHLKIIRNNTTSLG